MEAHLIKYGGIEVSLYKNAYRIAIQKVGERKVEVLNIPENTDSALSSFRQRGNLLFSTHVYHFTDDSQGSDFIPTGRFYMVFSTNNSTVQNAVLLQHRLEVIERRSELTLIVKMTGPSDDAVTTAIEVQKNDSVAVCEPEFIFNLSFNSDNDEPLLGAQWHLEHAGAGHDTDAHPGAGFLFADNIDAKVMAARRNHGVTGEGTTIAFIDLGVETTHPDFAPNKFTLTLNVLNSSTNIAPQSSSEVHGTRMVGVAAASDNGVGTLGVASDAKVIAIRVANGVSTTAIEEAYNLLVDKDVAVVCNGWVPEDSNFPASTGIQEAIQNLVENGRNGKGTCVLFTAGNNFPTTPKVTGFAGLSSTISIGASNTKAYVCSYSREATSSDDELFCIAPSKDGHLPGITTSDLTWGNSSTGAYTNLFGGTSAATALVSGVIALMVEANPELTVTQIKQIIRETCDKIGEANSSDYRQANYNQNGWDVAYGYGRINADRAVEKAIELMPPEVEELRFQRIAVKNGSLEPKERQYFSMELLDGFMNVILNSRSTGLNADVYVQKDRVPVIETGDYLEKSDGEISSDVITVNISEGLYYFLIEAKAGSGSFKLTVTNIPS